MALLNPRFEDAGAAEGEAASWTLHTSVAGQRIAGFGPEPAHAAEDFERWSDFKPTFDDNGVVLAFFQPALHGLEDFQKGWSNDVFLVALSEGAAQACPFGSAALEDFQDGWSNAPPNATWNDVTAEQGLFHGAAEETFETEWSGNELVAASWAQVLAEAAPFDGAAVATETFEGAWAHATTI